MRVETRRGAADRASEDPAAEWARVLEERAVMCGDQYFLTTTAPNAPSRRFWIELKPEVAESS